MSGKGLEMSDTNIGAGGFRRTRVRRPRHLPGWKPLNGKGCGCHGKGAAGGGRGSSSLSGDYLPPDGIGAIPRGLSRHALPLAKTAVSANPQVRAGMFLLNAAEKNPAAKRKVKVIVQRAKAGDPEAISAVKTLRVAKAVKEQKRQRAISAARARRRELAEAALPTAEAPLPRGIFKYWDKGAG